jgi:predicted AAA+ superfamily ATPase
MLEIKTDDIANRLRADNPWWVEPSRPDLAPMTWPRRAYFFAFREMLRQPVQRAVILMGARRVGKTTLLHQLIGESSQTNEFGKILFASIDAPTFSNLRLEQLLELFVTICPHDSNAPRLVVFDEIQYLPDWERHLKDLVDRFPRTKFIASGSAGAALKRKSAESGAGRFTDFELPPLTFAEFIEFSQQTDDVIEYNDDDSEVNFKNIDKLNELFVEYVNVGGYPEVVRSSAVRENMERFVKSDIVDKVLLRDLPSLYGITNIPELNRLFTTVAYNTGQLISLEALSQNSGITKPTISRYLEYLEAAFLIVRLRRVDVTARRLERERNFKVYLTNPSMRAALFGPVATDDDAMGALAETAVITQYLHSTVFRELAFANWGRGEVDIVRVSQSRQKPLWALDVKWSDRAARSDWGSLLEFASSNKLKAAWMTTKTIEQTDTRGAIIKRIVPTSVFAYRVGRLAATTGNVLSRYGLPETE